MRVSSSAVVKSDVSMQTLSYTLSLTLPLFILIGIGFIVVRMNFLDKASMRSLSWFVVNLAVPASIFSALSSRSFEDIFHRDFLLIYGGGSLLIFIVGFLIAKLRRYDISKAAFFGLGSGISNTILIGMPIVTQVFGEAALIPFALALLVENLLIVPITLALADSAKYSDRGFLKSLLLVIPNLFRNPILIAICVGLFTSLLDLPVPEVASSVVETLARSVAAVALVAIGGMLVGIQVKGMLKDISTIVTLKLVGHPLAVLLLVQFFPPMSELYFSVAILFSTLAMFSIYPVLGSRYGHGTMCAAVLLPTTILSFFSVNIALYLLKL
jgi:predicted permease